MPYIMVIANLLIAMRLLEIGNLIHTRRARAGLSQQQLAKLAGLSRLTINQLERGKLKDLGVAKLMALARVLGIDISAQARPAKENGLFMAAVTSGVSLSRQMDETTLARTLASGEIPPGFRAQIGALLEEAPLEILVKAVEESAHRQGVPAKKIWEHVFNWFDEFQVVRPGSRA